jgi:hypothetical protein
MTDPRAALAEATHADCIADWKRRPPGTMVTQHSLESHNEAAERRVAYLAERGVRLVTAPILEAAYFRVLDGPILDSDSAVAAAIFAALSGEVTA